MSIQDRAEDILDLLPDGATPALRLGPGVPNPGDVPGYDPDTGLWRPQAGGAQGSQGAPGSQGSDGAQGAPGTGAQGSQGHQGVQGPQGEVGESGGRGAQGVQGEPGSTGSQGARGPDGTMGFQGAQGQRGAEGPQGNVGSQGTQGSAGQTGNQGTQGAQGQQGTASAFAAPGYRALTSPPVSGTEYVNTLAEFVVVSVSFTLAPTLSVAAGVKVEIRPTAEATWTTWANPSLPVGAAALNGAADQVTFPVPAGWRYKVTATNASLGALVAIG